MAATLATGRVLSHRTNTSSNRSSTKPNASTSTERTSSRADTRRKPVAHTKRDLEARFPTFLNDRRFPMPQTNVLIERVEVDAAWPGRKPIVELDSWEYHRTRQAFEEDRKRDRRLKAAGWTVLRVTWRDLDEPGRLAAELAVFLS